MDRRSRAVDPLLLRLELNALLDRFEEKLKSSDLRSQVRALVPAFHKIRELGCSLVPVDSRAARDRILKYLLEYPHTIIDGDELMVVSGIQEWARRLRELRVEFGWKIFSGITSKEMSSEEDADVPGIDLSAMRPDQYVLLDTHQDRDAAYRWRVANEIRRRDLPVRDKILEFLRKNVGQSVTGEELRYVAGDRTEWARRVRELRTESGWPIVTQVNGRPDLPVGAYLLEADRQAPAHDRVIPDQVRREVLRRDEYRCVQCGWSRELWNQDDPRHLEAHHLTHHLDGGENVEDNLITICNVCHDVIHTTE